MRIVIILAITVIIHAQIAAQPFYSLNAGANIGKVTTKINGQTDKGIKGNFGYVVKTHVYIPVATNFLVQTGLEYETVNSKVDNNATTTTSGVTIKQMFTGSAWIGYMNIPLRFTYSKPAGNGQFFIGAGPVLGIGVAGRSKSTDITETTIGSTTTRNEYRYDEKITFGNADTSTKRTNLGVGLQLSYATAGNLLFSLYANKGLTNINNQTNYNTTTFCAGVTVGYIIGKKEK